MPHLEIGALGLLKPLAIAEEFISMRLGRKKTIA